MLRFCDDEALLIDRRSRTIYRLNASAAFLWGLITSGLPAAQAAAELAAAADLPFSEARDHVERSLAQWRDTPVAGAGLSCPTRPPVSEKRPIIGAELHTELDCAERSLDEMKNRAPI